jgi:hypothetical protein
LNWNFSVKMWVFCLFVPNVFSFYHLLWELVFMDLLLLLRNCAGP